MGVHRVAAGVGKAVGQGILGIIVLGCIAISLFFAYEFGSGKAASTEFAVAYGLAGAGLDLLKAVLPIIAAAAYTRSRAGLAWAAFAFLTMMSLWCAFGTTAGQLADKIANQGVAQIAAKEKTDKLARLRADRAALGTFPRATPESVKAAQDAVRAAADAKEQECGKVGPNCRARVADETARRAELAQTIRDQSTTAQADEIDRQIAAAEAIKVDVLTAAKDTDPQATSISKAFGISIESAALIGHVIFAVGVEIGSGLGLWLVFGHGGHAPAPASPTAPTPEPAPAQETAEEAAKRHRKRFFKACVFNGDGKVAAGTMYGAYCTWCHREGIEPMSVQAFGTGSPWMAKKRIGGVVHYLNCGLAPGLVQSTPGLRLVTA
jgi:RNA-binding protein YhbY